MSCRLGGAPEIQVLHWRMGKLAIATERGALCLSCCARTAQSHVLAAGNDQGLCMPCVAKKFHLQFVFRYLGLQNWVSSSMQCVIFRSVLLRQGPRQRLKITIIYFLEIFRNRLLSSTCSVCSDSVTLLPWASSRTLLESSRSPLAYIYVMKWFDILFFF